jgi:hypothetical protein
MMDPAWLAEIQALELEVVRREARLRLLAGLFAQQRQFVRGRARFRAAVCGRRAGKSYSVAVFLLDGAMSQPETLSLYLAISRGSARRILWSTLKKIDKELGLGGEFREAELRYILKNGSEIWLAGCPDSAHIETYRGPAYKRVAIDEAASFPSYLKPLINDVLIPALSDHRGDLALIGTPGVAPSGYLHDLSHGVIKGWSVAPTWTMLDNPHMPHAREEIDEIMATNGWDITHPTLQREYFAKWVADLGMLVYGALSPLNRVGGIPEGESLRWHYVLGIDLGASETRETTAYSLLAYSDSQKVAYVLETEGEAKATPSSIADRIQRYESRHRLDAIVMDAGALGSGYVRELKQRHRIPVQAAEKQNKRGYIELLNGDLQGGLLKIVEPSCAGLLSEMAVLPWADDKKAIEKKGVPNHNCDATLYAWRHCRQYASKLDAPKAPDQGTAAWAQAEERRIEEGLVREAKERRRRPWYQRRT